MAAASNDNSLSNIRPYSQDKHGLKKKLSSKKRVLQLSKDNTLNENDIEGGVLDSPNV